LLNHDLGVLDSFAESREASLRKPVYRSQPAEAALPEAIESACIFHLTKLPPLTYPLIIEELRPEDKPLGRFRFPHIADPVPAVGIAQRALACPLA
jgi:hypothetical protein